MWCIKVADICKLNHGTYRSTGHLAVHYDNLLFFLQTSVIPYLHDFLTYFFLEFVKMLLTRKVSFSKV